MRLFFTIFFVIVGVIVLGVSLYLIIRTKKINKKGIKVTATVVGTEKIEKNLNGKIVDLGYDTTFNVLYEGNNYTKKMRTTRLYEVGTVQSGMYIQNGNDGNFYLDEEGIYTGSIQNGLLMLYLSGIPFLLALVIAAPINQEILFAILFIYIVAFIVGVRVSPIGFSRFKYENPESAQGVNLKEFFKITDKSNKKLDEDEIIEDDNSIDDKDDE